MDAFMKLPQEKRVAVLGAAFACFGKTGYKKTSIADIANAAGISKASIFQYFGTKRDLYRYLFTYACDKILRAIPAGNDDFFDCLRLGSEIKLRVSAQYPGMFDFLSSLVTEGEQDIMDEMRQQTDKLVNAGLNTLFSNVNWDKFQTGINREMAINIVRWVNEGYVTAAIGREDVDTMVRELMGYLDLLKQMLYKEEYVK